MTQNYPKLPLTKIQAFRALCMAFAISFIQRKICANLFANGDSPKRVTFSTLMSPLSHSENCVAVQYLFVVLQHLF